MRSYFTSLKRGMSGLGDFFRESPLEALPLRQRLARYNGRQFKLDMIAGGNVALMAFPQAMAHAAIAGLPLSWGIMCCAVASIIGPLFAGSRFCNLGTTNATALLVFSAMSAYPLAEKLALMPVLVFLVGVVLVLGAYLRLADLVQYVSRSVVVGYVTGSALLIMANQLAAVGGLHLGQPATGRARTAFTLLWDTFAQAPQAHWGPFVLALATGGVYALLKWKTPKLPCFALALVAGALIAPLLDRAGAGLEYLTAFRVQDLIPGVPDLRNPRMLDHLSPLFSIAFAAAFLAALENSVMAKTLASRSGDRVEMNQEMLSVGAANLGCAFLSGMPASDSMTRSVLNQTSGAQTQLASMFSGLVCLIGAITVGPLVGHIPKAALASLIIGVAVSLVNLRHLRICQRATGSDAATLWITLAATLLMPLQVAIFVGVAASLMLYLRKASRPQLVEYEFNHQGELAEKTTPERRHPGISIVHVEGELFFGAAELFRTQIHRIVADTNLRVIILRLKNARHLDATSVMALEELIRFMRARHRHLIISGAMKDVYKVLRDSGLVEVLGREHIFPGSAKNPNLATRNALKHAQELLGTKEAEVRIWHDPGI